MKYWETRHRNFTYKPTLTREQHPGMLHGRIPDILPQQFKDLSQHSVFVAGSPEFVAGCVRVVKALGAADAMIHSEGYFGQAQPETAPASQMMKTT
jgi:CDP-4-dehydro-6-deoxyglucose reductase, E3